MAKKLNISLFEMGEIFIYHFSNMFKSTIQTPYRIEFSEQLRYTPMTNQYKARVILVNHPKRNNLVT